MKILYFHGFGSSAKTSTAQTLREELSDFEIVARDIPVDPAEALPFLKELVAREKPDFIIGTSMGGMYTQQMFGYRRIIVNPAFNMSTKSTVLTPGTFKFLNPREDGAATFTITPEIIAHFAAMEAHQFDGITEWDRDNVWGLFGDRDKIVHCDDIFKEHYKNYITFHGEHRLDAEVIKGTIIPLIREIIAKQ